MPIIVSPSVVGSGINHIVTKCRQTVTPFATNQASPAASRHPIAYRCCRRSARGARTSTPAAARGFVHVRLPCDRIADHLGSRHWIEDIAVNCLCRKGRGSASQDARKTLTGSPSPDVFVHCQALSLVTSRCPRCLGHVIASESEAYSSSVMSSGAASRRFAFRVCLVCPDTSTVTPMRIKSTRASLRAPVNFPGLPIDLVVRRTARITLTHRAGLTHPTDFPCHARRHLPF